MCGTSRERLCGPTCRSNDKKVTFKTESDALSVRRNSRVTQPERWRMRAQRFGVEIARKKNRNRQADGYQHSTEAIVPSEPTRPRLEEETSPITRDYFYLVNREPTLPRGRNANLRSLSAQYAKLRTDADLLFPDLQR
jgi:hypothetical protein